MDPVRRITTPLIQNGLKCKIDIIFFSDYQLGVSGGGVNPVGTKNQLFPKINFWGHPSLIGRSIINFEIVCPMARPVAL